MKSKITSHQTALSPPQALAAPGWEYAAGTSSLSKKPFTCVFRFSEWSATDRFATFPPELIRLRSETLLLAKQRESEQCGCLEGTPGADFFLLSFYVDGFRISQHPVMLLHSLWKPEKILVIVQTAESKHYFSHYTAFASFDAKCITSTIKAYMSVFCTILF